MRFVPMASGSSGNCTFVDTDTTHLLVDAGVTGKKIKDSLASLELEPKDLNGVLITHEHSDHLSGLAVLSKRGDFKIYATAGTIRAMRRIAALSTIDPSRFVEIRADEPFAIGDIEINPIEISHDAADPVGYRFMSGGRKAVVCTDLGCYTDYTVEALRDADALLLESNHDVNMLQVGPYPYRLKQRILGDYGHLSNAASGRLLSEVLNDHMKGIYLGHLSEQNNLPELAFETVRVELFLSDAGYHPDDLPLYVAERRDMSKVIEF